jgi:hypothetical protein
MLSQEREVKREIIVYIAEKEERRGRAKEKVTFTQKRRQHYERQRRKEK